MAVGDGWFLSTVLAYLIARVFAGSEFPAADFAKVRQSLDRWTDALPAAGNLRPFVALGSFSQLTHNALKVVIVSKVNNDLPGIIFLKLDVDSGT